MHTDADHVFQAHPTPACVPINLASVECDEIVYHQQTARHPSLSSMQYITVSVINHALDKYGAFLLGDSTGIGKGRTIAAVVREHRLRFNNVKVVWVSANKRLKTDAAFEYDVLGERMDDCTLFTSYAAITNENMLQSILDWLKLDWSDDAVRLMVMDECHALRNDSYSSQMMDALIESLPRRNRRLLYSSATAMSHSKHISYLKHLHLWADGSSAFSTEDEMKSELRKSNNALMELIAIELRSKGLYLTRQLSFDRVTVSHVVCNLSEAERRAYDFCASLVARHTMAYHTGAHDFVLSGSRKQNMFHRLVTGFKTRTALHEIEKGLRNGFKVVVSLMNTGEAEAEHARKEGTARRECMFNDVLGRLTDGDHDPLEFDIPMHPLDQIIEHFGGERVAEITGRSHRLETINGVTSWRGKPSAKTELEAFQSGKKKIAVISRAGGIGISLHDHADDDQRRMHIVLELPWSAEDFLQQIGRTHRASSASSPHYVILTSDVPGEARFSNAIVQKLASLGALVKADASACIVPGLCAHRFDHCVKKSLALFLSLSMFVTNEGERPRFVNVSQQEAHVFLDSTVAHAKVSLVKRLNDQSNEESHQTSHHMDRLRGIAMRLFPGDAASVFFEWSPSTHVYFPRLTKQRVFTLLLCSRNSATHRTLGLLPDVLLEKIAKQMATIGSASEIGAAAKEFASTCPRFEKILNMSTDCILNKLLTMTIASQRVLINFMSSIGSPPDFLTSKTLQAFAERKCGAGIRVRIGEVRRIQLDRESRGIAVRMQYEPCVPKPPQGAVFYANATGRVGFLYANSMTFVDGTTFETSSISVAGDLAYRGFNPTTLQRWNNAVQQFQRACARRIGRLPREYTLVTFNPMKHWHRSLKCVLRVDSADALPNGAIGLLLNVV